VNTFSTFVDPNLTPAAAPDTKEYELEIRDVLKRAAIRKERRGCLVGIVVSDKNAKSISIKVDREKYFPKYDAILKRTKKFMAHDENEVCEMGDLVRVVPCRPMSKKKRHVVLDIIRKGNRLDIVLTKEERTRDPNKFY
jgi:small subunit ribosomal protein S17